jgi:heme exporter protein A
MAVMREIASAFETHQHPTTARLQAAHLACLRGDRPVFSGLSFDLKAGEALMVAGPNGSGKSSLLRLLAGLLPVADGALSVDGLPPHKMHYLGHADGLKPSLTLAETLSFEAVFGPAMHADITALLGLPAHDWQYVGDLSAGQKRRLSMARLLMDPRPLWLLDEPLTALDAAGRDLVDNLARGHLAKGGMIVAASHEALAFADKTLTLDAPS